MEAKTTANLGTDQYNHELAEAEEEYKRGEYIAHDEMKKVVSGW